MTIYANPPKRCDFCHRPITKQFSDARVPRVGRWGNLCPGCSTLEGVQYGTGLGQLYELKDDGRYHKVEG